MTGFARLVSVTGLFLLLAACGGGATNPYATTPDGGGVDGGGEVDPPVYSLGSGSGDNFIPGELYIPVNEVTPGEPVTITATIADQYGNLRSDVASIAFVSDCSSSAQATIDSPVDTANGIATTLYTADRCVGADEVVATTVIDGVTLRATGILTVRAVYRIGSGSGDNFIPGQLGISIDSLSAGGSTDVFASIVDQSGNLRQAADLVTFSSDCSAELSASIPSPIFTSGGVASTSYTARGCVGEDIITASATVNSVRLTATGTVTVAPAVLGQLMFVSAVPTNIGLAGHGLPEISSITFRLLDTTNNPVVGEIVDFLLSTEVGGITLSDDFLTTDVNGDVRVYLHSGTVATSARVRATVRSKPELNTVSDWVVITTGIPDQDSMTVGPAVLNPEGWDINGVEDIVSVIAGDHFNNPVPNGTKFQFRTEGGFIDDECETVNGSCEATWLSANPRTSDGRVTILVSALGEESFLDVSNGDEILDDTDLWLGDVPEPFVDFNENDTYDTLVEPFIDNNNDHTYSGGDGEYNGLLCNAANNVNTCSSNPNVHIWQSFVIVMAESWARITFSTPDIDATSGIGTTTMTVTGFDNGQTMPFETSIEIEALNGILLSPEKYTVGNTTFAVPYTIVVATDGISSTGPLTVTVKTPKNSAAGFATIDIRD